MEVFMKGKYQKKKAPKEGGWKKGLLIGVLILLVLLIAGVIGGVIYYNSILNKINKVDVEKFDYSTLDTESTEGTEEPSIEANEDETTEATTEATTEPHVASSADYLNILVVGQASRYDEAERFADSAMLITINTYEKTLTMTSLLRDTLVRPPDYRGHTFGAIKLTTVYHLGYIYHDNEIAGSMELMNLTLYKNFGIEVDYNFEVDFDAFCDVIDLLGGVDLELTEAEANYLNDDEIWVYHHFEAGMAHLNGMETLCYARMRHAEGDADSDIVRTSRQRHLLEIIIAKLKTLSISELNGLVEKALPYISTSMTKEEITDTVMLLLPMLADLQIKSGGTCPNSYHGELIDIYNDGMLHSCLIFYEGETKAYMRAITEGEGN